MRNPFIVSIVTDFEAHALWMDPCVDFYCVAAEETKVRLIARGAPADDVHAFQRRLRRETAVAQLRIGLAAAVHAVRSEERVDLAGVVLDDRRLDAHAAQDTRNDLAEPAEPGHDHRVALFDRVRGTRGAIREPRRDHALPRHHQQRGRHH